ncbi:hypothetical protein CC80DRAFT_566898, partial [Byssothecium circinans]
TYDHRILRTRLPVRSAIYKQDTGGLVLRWVTTGEYLLLYVFVVFFVKFLCGGFWCAGNFVSRVCAVPEDFATTREWLSLSKGDRGLTARLIICHLICGCC